MDRTIGHNRTAPTPYPPLDPFDRRMLDVGEGHTLYVEQCGAPGGTPVIVLHGGPGGGCSPAMRRFFDPKRFRVVLFDQRGCGRSRPNACVTANTTAHLIDDIERIRETLGITRFIVFGGSWGATLALLYAQAHPERVAHLVLRGVFLATKAELDWFYAGGAGAFWPDLWEKFVAPIPAPERDDLIAAYHRRLFSGDLAQEQAHGRVWAQWENALASTAHGGDGGEPGAEHGRTFARLENHYFLNQAFIAEGQILRERWKIEHIPTTIVQGRLDMICPPRAAFELARGWAKCDLRLLPLAGHALSEPAITRELLTVMDSLR